MGQPWAALEGAATPGHDATRDGPCGWWSGRWSAARELVGLLRYAGARPVAATLATHLVAGAAPTVFMIATSLALRDVAGSGRWSAAAVAALVVGLAVAPLQVTTSREVARRVDAACVARLTEYALRDAPLDVLERADVIDQLSLADEAFERWALTPGEAVEGALALVARYVQLVGALSVLAAVQPWTALAAGGAALVARGAHTRAYGRWGRLTRAFAPLRRRVAYVRGLATGTRASKEIRSLGLSRWLDERYVQENRAILEPVWSWRRRVYDTPFRLYAVLVLVGLAAALLVLVRTQDVRDAAAVSLAVQALLMCGRFGAVFPEADTKLVFGRTAWDAVRAAERLADSDARRSDGARPLLGDVPPGPVRFTQVRFGYEPGRPVLDGLDLELVPGGSTALIGVNGAGKSTIVKMLVGVHEPDAGAVTVGGVDLRDVDPVAWRRGVAVTFQDFVRYGMSVRENVAMGSIEHLDDDEGIRSVLAAVGLGPLLDELPAGLATPLSRDVPGGRDLSGGQWQRLALARSLFAVRHGAWVLVLDEPTAQLDARGEAEFYDSFLELTRGVTSLVISHRFSTVRRADRIVVVDGGRVVEAGTHDELMAVDGVYARMFELQARRFAGTGPSLAGRSRGVGA